ncbi:hypothetical protein NECAME_04112 [Necator americanus]|uniref:Uncharacterized protein n=1 Tax=Necator americanus TaxID=51031 RepID=W2SZV5_NECAM|nr:hypothetical protein NECAME_04112 [Necator americanus]ETN74247.1 hypothetical protein NECAME_04112 [Necator americanus]
MESHKKYLIRGESSRDHVCFRVADEQLDQELKNKRETKHEKRGLYYVYIEDCDFLVLKEISAEVFTESARALKCDASLNHVPQNRVEHKSRTTIITLE